MNDNFNFVPVKWRLHKDKAQTIDAYICKKLDIAQFNIPPKRKETFLDSELQYRVEVQNRVYRREMAQLELELARLEKQLAQEPVEPSRASSSASIPQRNPSIGGGLPLLLLSVLPPVIPRASWPSADSSGKHMLRLAVTISKDPPCKER